MIYVSHTYKSSLQSSHIIDRRKRCWRPHATLQTEWLNKFQISRNPVALIDNWLFKVVSNSVIQWCPLSCKAWEKSIHRRPDARQR